MAKTDILHETAPGRTARMASKLYGASQDRGVPVTAVKREQPAVGGKRKVTLKPKKATQTSPKGGV